MLGTAYNFAGCSCTAGIRKGKPPCAQEAFVCPCVAGSCSCTRSPSGGDGGGLSPVQTIHSTSSMLTSSPPSPTERSK